VHDPVLCSFEVKDADADSFIVPPTGRLAGGNTAATGTSSSLSESPRNEGFSLSSVSHVSTL
jgi:hypothetical protein